MKAIEQYFPAALFTMLYNVGLTFDSVDEMSSVTIQMKATEQFFLVVLFFIYAVQGGYNFDSVDEIQKPSPFK